MDVLGSTLLTNEIGPSEQKNIVIRGRSSSPVQEAAPCLKYSCYTCSSSFDTIVSTLFPAKCTAKICAFERALTIFLRYVTTSQVFLSETRPRSIPDTTFAVSIRSNGVSHTTLTVSLPLGLFFVCISGKAYHRGLVQRYRGCFALG